jgi:uncharacterized protein YjiS (DUF1127 family)
METTMASTPITYRAELETPAPRGLAASIERRSAAFGAYGIWHDIRVLEGRARQQADAASEPSSLSAWLGGVALRAARAIARELRIRRDMRHLMAMDDRMLKDIGLTRADIGDAVRYGRD